VFQESYNSSPGPESPGSDGDHATDTESEDTDSDESGRIAVATEARGEVGEVRTVTIRSRV